MKSAFCKNEEILNTVRGLNPATNPIYSTDDVGNGRLFSDVFGDVCRYNVTTKEFSIYDGVKSHKFITGAGQNTEDVISFFVFDDDDNKDNDLRVFKKIK